MRDRATKDANQLREDKFDEMQHWIPLLPPMTVEKMDIEYAEIEESEAIKKTGRWGMGNTPTYSAKGFNKEVSSGVAKVIPGDDDDDVPF